MQEIEINCWGKAVTSFEETFKRIAANLGRLCRPTYIQAYRPSDDGDYHQILPNTPENIDMASTDAYYIILFVTEGVEEFPNPNFDRELLLWQIAR